MAIDRATDTRIKFLENIVKGDIRDLQADAVSASNVILTPASAGTFTITESSIGGVPVALNGKSFLLANQTNAAQNGIYVVLSISPNTISHPIY